MFKGRQFYIKNDLFSNRLKIAMDRMNYKQIDLIKRCKPTCEKVGIKEFGSNTLSQYVTGKAKPSQKALSVLAEALGVNEVWLMGYEVDEMEISREDFKLIKTLNKDGQEEMALALLDYIFSGIDRKFDTKKLNDIWIKIRGHYDRG
jgi:transcriptional regulator with XRE-family HTH domain